MSGKTALIGLLLFLSPWDISGQSMMSGSRDLRGGREAMAERLSSTTPEQRAYVEALREGELPSTSLQRIRVRGGSRHYTSGSAGVAESLGEITYTLRRPGWGLRASASPLRFSSGDTLSIAGLASLEARLDLRVRGQDSIRFSFRGPTVPGGLTSAEVSALESIGTSTVDLSSIQLGTPAGVEVRYIHVRPIGRALTLSATLGGGYEPEPGGSSASYWRGRTVRAGLELARGSGSTRVGGGMEVSRSFADSLGGRNLFRGGGTVLARAEAVTFLGEEAGGLVGASLSYFRPFGSERTVSASVRDPIGDFAAVNVVGVWPWSTLFLTPAVVVSHESSEATTSTSLVTGSGWSLSGTLAVDVPLREGVSLTPEVGFAGGRVRTDVTTTVAGVSQTNGRVDRLSGWWVATDLSLTF